MAPVWVQGWDPDVPKCPQSGSVRSTRPYWGCHLNVPKCPQGPVWGHSGSMRSVRPQRWCHLDVPKCPRSGSMRNKGHTGGVTLMSPNVPKCPRSGSTRSTRLWRGWVPNVPRCPQMSPRCHFGDTQGPLARPGCGRGRSPMMSPMMSSLSLDVLHVPSLGTLRGPSAAPARTWRCPAMSPNVPKCPHPGGHRQGQPTVGSARCPQCPQPPPCPHCCPRCPQQQPWPYLAVPSVPPVSPLLSPQCPPNPPCPQRCTTVFYWDGVT